ncbi:MAG TPA: ATP synthase F0 subunit B [Candidatus Gastranaerophilaceae bacterium]|nr:ATP synthase F0 subunit B [Candidatus Gastranaerophilaceae bacterium]HPT41774.1 ATP synthase F0 subunit B [Candidatus Gastranaerophilaceae bacterium]
MINQQIQQIWHIIVESNTFNFIFFAAIFIWIFKKIDIKKAIESLHTKIVEAIEAAKKSKEEAHANLKQVEKLVENLPQELEEMIKEAKASAHVIGEKILDDAKKQVENIGTNAKKIIDAEEKMIISKLTQKASKASIEAAKSHITNSLVSNPELHEKYINESIEELDRLNFGK